MQKLIVGLGNPGEKYKNNRHNVGYIAVDRLLKRNLSKETIVKKTNVFMNSSGEVVKNLVEQYRLNPSNLWIIHDDLDIRLGEYKIQRGKGPKLHYGISSIEDELRETKFWRVRIGVDNREPGPHFAKASRGEDYVLQDFTDKERKVLDGVISEICKKLGKF